MPGAVGDLSDAEITVVIPVKDGASTLEGCLRSIRADATASGLSSGRFEIVVADNGSSDGSPDIAAGLGCRLVRVPAEQGRADAARRRPALQEFGQSVERFLVEEVLLLCVYLVHLLQPNVPQSKTGPALSHRKGDGGRSGQACLQ